MSTNDRTWPVALVAVAVGALAGAWIFGSPFDALGPTTPTVDPRDGLRGPIAPPPRPLPPPRYRPPMVLSNSGTYKALDDLKGATDPILRASGAGRLSLSVEPERVLPALIYALENDADAYVRLVAAQSIGRLGATEGLAPLTRAAADDPSPRVRAMAMEAHDSLMARVPVARERLPGG